MMQNRMILRALLAVVGAGIVFLGLNIGLGGIETMGWQGSGSSVDVTDPALFAVRDSHVRFIGGVWMGVGLLFFCGCVFFKELRPTLIALTALVFVGGVVRLLSLDWNVLLGMWVLPSLIAELFLFPALGYWIYRAKKQKTN